MNPESPAARLAREPFAFDFFQAVRLLEAVRPDRRPVGRDGPPDAEVVTFASRQSLAFPAASIDQLDAGGDDQPPRMAVNFFGLTGPNGVLPAAYTQWLYARERAAGDPEAHAASDWFDRFTHRMLSLFYRAWAKYRLPIGYETAARTGGRDPITTTALALVGLGTPGLAGRFEAHGIADEALLRYANLFVAATRPAAGLERLLGDYFGVPVAVEQFHGRWRHLDVENQTRLGRRAGANDRLGHGTVVGRRVWDAAGGVRVRVGPLTGADFRDWLPDRPRLRVLAALARFYTRDGLDFDVQIVVTAADVPPLRLTRPADPAAPRLGWNTWVGSRPPARDAGDAVFARAELVRHP